MAVKLSLKKIIIIIVIVAIAISVGTALALYFLLKPEKMTSSTPEQVTTATVATSDLGGIDANKLLASLQKQFPTVKQAYSYDTAHDPETKLGTKGGYTGGISFYDSRTGAQPTGNYTAEAGGSIEVYKTVAEATTRVNQLKSAALPGAKDRIGDSTQIDRFIVRASSKLDTKSQSALLAALSQLAMGQLANVGNETNDSADQN